MKRLSALFLVMAVLTTLVAGCKSSGDITPNNPAATYKDTLTIGIESDVVMNPWLTTNASNSYAARQLFDTLIRVEEDGSFSPSLATNWEFVDDTHVRLTLRDDVVFHDGSKFTAEDVMFFFDSLSTLSTLVSKYEFVDIPNCVVNNDYDITLALKYSYAETLNLLGNIYIVPKQAYLEMGEDAFGNDPVGSGPFKFVSWTAGSEFTVERFDDYWGDKAQTQYLRFRVIPEASSRIVELETGGIDLCTTPGTANISRVKNTDGLAISMGPSARYVLLTFSMKDELLANKDVRYALCYAIDRATLVDACYEGNAYLMDTMWPRSLFGAKTLPDYEYDLDKAKELMKNAGYENGFEIDLQVVGDEEKLVCEAIQNMWAKLNVKTNIIQMSWVNYEAAGNLYQAAVRTGAATNLTNCIIIYKTSFGRTLQVTDTWLDESVQRSDQMVDAEERKALLDEIQDHLYDVRYSMPLANTPMVYALSEKVEGFVFNAYGVPYLSSAKVTK